MRVFSYGGGVQSTAALVLAAQGKIDFPTFLFANVGEKAENPATIAYVDEVAAPFAAQHGIELVMLQRKNRAGSPQDLYDHLLRPSRSIDIPVRMANGAPGNRNCTNEFKVQVIAKWTKARGATEAQPATLGLGISSDEWHRANDSRIAWQTNEFPLLDLDLNRDACAGVIASAGLPVPPKSSCWFCPFKSKRDWMRMKAQEPETFARVVALEDVLNARRAEIGKDRIFFHGSARPLAVAVGEYGEQLSMMDDLFDGCDSGHCMT